MKKVILDTSFILTAVRQKIDFFTEFQDLGMKVVVPKQVMKELESIANSGQGKLRENSRLALKVLNFNDFKEMNLEGKNVDNAIINFAKNNPDVIVATLDREIKNKIKNSKLVIRQKKRLEEV